MPHSKRIRLLPLLFILPLLAVPAMAGDDDHDGRHLHAQLIGFQEVPAVSTVASGRLQGTISRDEQSSEYGRADSGLHGRRYGAHINIARPRVNDTSVSWF